MRKAMLTVAGLAGMSLLLCGSGEVLAQTDTATGAPGTADRDATDTRVQGTPPGDVRVGTPGAAGTPSPGTQATGTAEGTGTGGAGTGTGATGTAGAGTGTTAGAGTGTVAAGAGQATGGAGAGTAELQSSVLQLQSEVAQLRQELAQLRAALADVNASAGVGGSGQAGVNPPVTTPGSVPLRAGTAQETNPRGASAQDTSNAGDAVVNAIYTGTVRSVSDGQLELLDEDGQPFRMELGKKTRVLRDGKLISTQQLKKGTRVRVTVDLAARGNQAMEITTLPAR